MGGRQEGPSNHLGFEFSTLLFQNYRGYQIMLNLNLQNTKSLFISGHDTACKLVFQVDTVRATNNTKLEETLVLNKYECCVVSCSSS